MAIASVQEKRAMMQERMALSFGQLLQAPRADADVLLIGERRTVADHRYSTFLVP